LCCWAENISSGSKEPQILISAPTPRSRKSQFWLRLQPPASDSFLRYRYLENTFFDFSNRIKIVLIYKNFFSHHDFFLLNFFCDK
jgi:hypothetical protein